MTMPSEVTIVEVGPRDGLQNEVQSIPTDIKIEFINRLSQTGLKVIEATSFVSEKWIPQLADHTEVYQGIKKQNNVSYPVLVPNAKGLERAMAAGAKSIAVFASATESFSKKNINCTISESLDSYSAVVQQAKENNISVRGYVSCAFACPYEGEVNAQAVTSVATALYEMGCSEISLADTIGKGNPKQAKHLIKTVSHTIPIDSIAAHFHDTYGQALANIYAVLELGVSTIDCSVAGLGGCPYARGATGNVATEDVLYLLQGLGIGTGVDLSALIEAGEFITHHLSKTTQSKVALAMGKGK